MSRPISIDATLDTSGGSDDQVSQTATVDSESAVLQVENRGSSTDVDFHLEARLDDSLSWADWIEAYSAVGNGSVKMDPIDLESVAEVRVRIVNWDGSNQADVRAELETR